MHDVPSNEKCLSILTVSGVCFGATSRAGEKWFRSQDRFLATHFPPHAGLLVCNAQSTSLRPPLRWRRAAWRHPAQLKADAHGLAREPPSVAEGNEPIPLGIHDKVNPFLG